MLNPSNVSFHTTEKYRSRDGECLKLLKKNIGVRRFVLSNYKSIGGESERRAFYIIRGISKASFTQN